MFSLNRFYNVIHNNLISHFNNGRSFYFYPFGTYDTALMLSSCVDQGTKWDIIQRAGLLSCYFADQEPWYDYTIPLLEKAIEAPEFSVSIFANSEISEFKTKYLSDNNAYDWYYFFHGFLALDWYRDFQYIKPVSFAKFDKVFICYNHIISKYRSYRLHLVSNLISNDLIKFGHVSLPLSNDTMTWQDVLADKDCCLSTKAKMQVYKALTSLTSPLQIDEDVPAGHLSAEVNFDQLTSALWHVVTETVYFLPKLHLTEKVFKPIVAKRPFILVAAPGNLAYLKRYGFKTFDQWVDESYDNETDDYLRIEKITAEIKKLCQLDHAALEQMHQEMQEILEYNYNHFYNDFKSIITNELVDNFAKAIDEINKNRTSKYAHIIEYPDGYLDDVKSRLIR